MSKWSWIIPLLLSLFRNKGTPRCWVQQPWLGSNEKVKVFMSGCLTYLITMSGGEDRLWLSMALRSIKSLNLHKSLQRMAILLIAYVLFTEVWEHVTPQWHAHLSDRIEMLAPFPWRYRYGLKWHENWLCTHPLYTLWFHLKQIS